MDDDWNTDVDNQPHKDYYKVLEIDYDATDEDIRLSFRKLALKWHPDKHLGSDTVTSKFQDINEAYRVLSDPDRRGDYDVRRVYEIKKYTLREYLTRFKGMILTPNGLGMSQYGNTKSMQEAKFDVDC
ncbi:Chaperone protein dnaJ [Zostera marina]|uniref:Chaperone protein dnaJ n=1 Tax=Zostera marina TaxID=29655 RepID=A0A0K9NP66_ZOSMR|nr:Chaperone protein dnaJ [Zostera marina]